MAQQRRLNKTKILLIMIICMILVSIYLSFYLDLSIVTTLPSLNDNIIIFQTDSSDPFKHISSAYNFSPPIITDMKNQDNYALSEKKFKKRELKKYEDIINAISDIKCNYSGRIFGLGIPKTGTSTISLLLRLLGYKCVHDTCNHMLLRSMYEHRLNGVKYKYLIWSTMPFVVDDISFSFINKENYKHIYKLTQISQIFSDQPWSYLYPLFDAWYPNNIEAKYIYTFRNNTYNRINSVLKHQLMIEFRQMRKQYLRAKLNYTDSQIQDYVKNKPIYWNSKGENDLIEHQLLVEWIMYNARLYEKHHENVLKYFGSTNRIGIDKDLLMLCLECESQQELWWKITKFLGCNKTNISVEFPHVLKSETTDVITQKDYLPHEFSLDWRNYNFSNVTQNTFNLFYDVRLSPKQRIAKFAKEFLHFDLLKQKPIQ